MNDPELASLARAVGDPERTKKIALLCALELGDKIEVSDQEGETQVGIIEAFHSGIHSPNPVVQVKWEKHGPAPKGATSLDTMMA